MGHLNLLLHWTLRTHIDDTDNWPKFSKFNFIPDNNNKNCGSYHCHTGFMPYKSWPNPVGMKEKDLFGDKDKLLKGRVNIIPTPL